MNNIRCIFPVFKTVLVESLGATQTCARTQHRHTAAHAHMCVCLCVRVHVRVCVLACIHNNICSHVCFIESVQYVLVFFYYSHININCQTLESQTAKVSEYMAS
jgi:hypothetical protein